MWTVGPKNKTQLAKPTKTHSAARELHIAHTQRAAEEKVEKCSQLGDGGAEGGFWGSATAAPLVSLSS